MKKIIFATMLLTSMSSYADIIKCGFTEPFVSFEYNTATETLNEHEAVLNKKRIVKNVSFQIKYAGTFLLKSKSGKLLAELRLNNKGSDGASDAVYPYDVTYLDATGQGVKVLGGCTSSLKPMVKEAE